MTYPVCSLDCTQQIDALPHVDVSVQGTRVRDLVLGAGKAEDGLEVSRFAKDPSFGGQSVATQAPELETERRTGH